MSEFTGGPEGPPYLTNQPLPPHMQQHNVVGDSELTRGLTERQYPDIEYIPPTAWQSVPGAVRFAVWVWAVSVILGAVLAVLFAIVFVVSAGAVLGGL